MKRRATAFLKRFQRALAAGGGDYRDFTWQLRGQIEERRNEGRLLRWEQRMGERWESGR